MGSSAKSSPTPLMAMPRRRVFARGVHGFRCDLGGGSGERGEDAAGMDPLRGVLVSKDPVPVKIAGPDLADRGVAAVRAANGGAQAEAALGKVEAVAHGAADTIVGNPADKRSVDAAFEDEVLDEAADGIVGERGGYSGAQAEAAAQAAGHVVFAAALPGAKVARGVDAHVAGIEAKHDLAEADAVPAAVGIGNGERVHGQTLL